MKKHRRPPPSQKSRLPNFSFSGGLGLAAITYVSFDYMRHWSPECHEKLQPVLWSVLALVAVARVPFYKHWNDEVKAAVPFVGAFVFMLCALLFEAVCVRFVTVVLGGDWHRETRPLPDTGQWLLLALNEKLPPTIVEILRARVIGLHHFLMLFIMLAFSVLFGSVKAPGLGLGARYMFTMGIGRLLRAISFVATILPSARPWCATARYSIPSHPHRWAQKYYSPYASDPASIRQLLHLDMVYHTNTIIDDPRPDWGSKNFLIDFLRPNASEDSSWFGLLKMAGGGCNDLLYSGHMLVAVLTAMAWTEAYGGFSSALIWAFVLHSAQREIRERHHYSVDCFVAIYVGILLWRMTGFVWRSRDAARAKRLDKLEKIQSKLIQAAKDSDIEEVRDLLKKVDVNNQSNQASNNNSTAMWLFSGITILSTLVLVILAFTFTSDG